ncbi:hypothetical protein A3SI_18151 [Nitritalea halalkaliphila LW7]|uniref:Outer membrane protein beta-barrel domain-containing protein n=1 Tax=Nitritalea halalkaliphila LW7 TaxID=1189621 RepID=I5BUV9_9BACT|nr:hypothetical protein [Nitritalea halalkaliphila]EIM73361.1 hypothetical protein A3SI_18151 [Nitritalea halalkaliphila LW7]
MFLFFLQTLVFAQEAPKTLFSAKPDGKNLGIMVAPGLQLTQLADAGSLFFTIQGGLVIQDKFTIGAFYGKVLNDPRPLPAFQDLPARAHLDAWQAGGFLSYTWQANRLVHLNFPLYIGVMELEIDDAGRAFDFPESTTLFFEPGAQMELNLHRFARLYAGVGYRIMGATFEQAAGVPAAGNALTFSVGLKMGIFKFSDL